MHPVEDGAKSHEIALLSCEFANFLQKRAIGGQLLVVSKYTNCSLLPADSVERHRRVMQYEDITLTVVKMA